MTPTEQHQAATITRLRLELEDLRAQLAKRQASAWRPWRRLRQIVREEVQYFATLVRSGHNDEDELSIHALSAKLDATNDIAAAVAELKAASGELKKAVEANK